MDRKKANYPSLDKPVSPILQQSATPEDFANHIDTADWLIRTRCPAPVIPGLTRDLTAEERHRQQRETFLKAAQFVDPKYHAALEGLIEDFELEFVGFERCQSSIESS